MSASQRGKKAPLKTSLFAQLGCINNMVLLYFTAEAELFLPFLGSENLSFSRDLFKSADGLMKASETGSMLGAKNEQT